MSEFACEKNADCNGQGTCENGKCFCNPEWDAKEDCTGNLAFWNLKYSTVNWIVLKDIFLTFHVSLYGLVFECVNDGHCNEHGTCNLDSRCVCDDPWDSLSDCLGMYNFWYQI